jgi:hypothetical protein
MKPEKPTEPSQNSFTLMLETRVLYPLLDERIVRHALSGPVIVLDAGNCFNPLRLARSIRRQTVDVTRILDRIQVARAFTCFQVIPLLEQTCRPAGPVYVLRLLDTFTDEVVPAQERLRLLLQVSDHVQRLRRATALTVTLRTPLPQEDPILIEWITRLKTSADHIIAPLLSTPTPPAQLF